MKVALCLSRIQVGGAPKSVHLVHRGLLREGIDCDLILTGPTEGDDHYSALDRGWDFKAINLGQTSLRYRLDNTYKTLLKYDAVVNNHSREVRHIIPALPMRVHTLSVVRSTQPDHIIKWAIRNSPYLDALVGISPAVCKALRKLPAKAPIVHIPNSVPNIYSEHKPIEPLGNRLRLLYVGRFEDKAKNISILPRIVRRLHARGLRTELTVVGNGPDKDALVRTIKMENVCEDISLVGAKTRPEVLELMQTHDFLLAPSRYEGFGLVVAEAMACGLIPITSGIESFRWLLGPSHMELIASEEDPNIYADRICALCKEPTKYIELQRRLRERQRKEFSPKITISMYIDVLTNMYESEGNRKKPVNSICRALPLRRRFEYSRLYQYLRKLYHAFHNWWF